MTGRANIKDVAERASVSVGTVSNFLNKNKPIAPATAERISNAIRELGFIPNAAVRVMQGARNHALAFLVPDLSNPFLADVARGIEDVALEREHIVITCNTDGDRAREQTFARVLAQLRVAGAIAMAMTDGGEPLQLLRHSGARVVLVGAHSDDYLTVLTDNARAGYLAMRHLLSRGHRQCAFFGGPGAEPQLAERLHGMNAAIANSGKNVVLTRFDAHGNDMRSRVQAANELLDNLNGATAVICANDLLALALETAALRRHIRIPDEIAIVGHDDIEDASSAVVPITTIHHSGRELGAHAAMLALGLRDSPFPISAPELMIRSST